MAEYADPIDPREGLEEFTDFQGLRNNVSAEAFGRGDLVTALNCDIDDSLGISRRKGYSAVKTSAIDRSLFASGATCLGVGSDTLKQVNADYSTTVLRTGLTATRPLSYAAVGERIYWSNGIDLGCVQNGANRTWGLALPAAPYAAASSGSLPAGKYQIAVTYLRSDGQESGAARAGTIELTGAATVWATGVSNTGGIALSNIPVSSDPTVTIKVIYMTSAGGKTLYRAGVVANATTTFSIMAPLRLVSPLLTQFLSAPPAGEFIGYFNGWMLVAKGDRLYPSEPYAPELFDFRKSIPFTDRITMVAPVKDGVWIGTDSQVIWIAGESPEKWDFKVAAEYGVIRGTVTFNDSELIGDGSAGGERVAFFATKRGLRAGHLGGRLLNLDRDRFAYPIQERGAGIVRRYRGIAQFLVTLQGSETAGNVAV